MSAILDKLLKGQKVEWKTLGDVSVLYGGLTGKNKADFENGNAKYRTVALDDLRSFRNVIYPIAKATSRCEQSFK